MKISRKVALSNILLAAFVALVFANNVLSFSIPSIVFLVVSFVIALTSDRDGVIAFVMCCIPFSTVFQYKYAIIICIIAYGIRYYQDIKIKYAPLLVVLMMIIWEMLHIIAYVGTSLSELLRSFVEIIFILFLMSNSYREYNYPRIVRWYAVSSVSVCLIILLNQVRGRSISDILYYYTIRRFGASTVEGTFIASFNPNVLAIICIIGIACLMQIIIEKQQHIIDYVLVSLLAIFAVMTMSIKVLALALIIVILAIADQKKIVKSIQITLLAVVLLTAVMYVLNRFLPTVLEHFASRLIADDISNGRNDLFGAYNKYIFSRFDRLLFGIGLQDNLTRLRAMGFENVPHNGLQELIVVWGIPGLLMFLFFLSQFIITTERKLREIPIRRYIPFIVMIVFVQFAQMITSGRYLLMFALSYISLVSFTTTDEERTGENDTYETGIN